MATEDLTLAAIFLGAVVVVGIIGIVALSRNRSNSNGRVVLRPVRSRFVRDREGNLKEVVVYGKSR